MVKERIFERFPKVKLPNGGYLYNVPVQPSRKSPPLQNVASTTRQTTKSSRLIPNTDTGLRNAAPKPKTRASIVECQPPEILVKIVKNHNKHLRWFEQEEDDMLTIPVHDLSKKFDVLEIVDAIYVRIQ